MNIDVYIYIYIFTRIYCFCCRMSFILCSRRWHAVCFLGQFYCYLKIKKCIVLSWRADIYLWKKWKYILHNKKQTSFHGNKCLLRGSDLWTEPHRWYNSYRALLNCGLESSSGQTKEFNIIGALMSYVATWGDLTKPYYRSCEWPYVMNI